MAISNTTSFLARYEVDKLAVQFTLFIVGCGLGVITYDTYVSIKDHTTIPIAKLLEDSVYGQICRNALTVLVTNFTVRNKW